MLLRPTRIWSVSSARCGSNASFRTTLVCPYSPTDEPLAFAHLHGEPHDRVVVRLPVHLGQHRVRLRFGEEAAAGDRRKLRGIAEHQHRHAERHQVAPQLRIDHRAFVDHDQLGLGGGRVLPQLEGRGFLPALARAIDQRVDRRRAPAALAAHHQRGFAGEGRILHLAVDVRRQMARECRLAGARIAEQPEKLRRAGLAGPVLQPARDGVERGVLMGGEFGHEIRDGGERRLVATRRILKQAWPRHKEIMGGNDDQQVPCALCRPDRARQCRPQRHAGERPALFGRAAARGVLHGARYRADHGRARLRRAVDRRASLPARGLRGFPEPDPARAVARDADQAAEVRLRLQRAADVASRSASPRTTRWRTPSPTAA